MADRSPIVWTDATWNVINGCAVVSPGCTNCYAMRLAGTRFRDHPTRRGLTIDSKAGPVWNGQVRLIESLLDQPLRWRRPRRIFVCAHGDLFHEAVPDVWVAEIYAVMIAAQHLNSHTFQVLTKRPARARDLLRSEAFWDDVNVMAADIVMQRTDPLNRRSDDARATLGDYDAENPPPGIWHGVSVEDQTRADERIPILLDTPAAVRWISGEPLLGPVDLDQVPSAPGATTRKLFGPLSGYCQRHFPRTDCGCERQQPRIGWLVVGGESGPGARPMHPDWARQLRDQCAAAGVPFLFKQWGDWAAHEDFEAGSWRAGATLRVVPALSREGGSIACAALMERVGKRAAGRLLDGQLHDAYPEARP